MNGGSSTSVNPVPGSRLHGDILRLIFEAAAPAWPKWKQLSVMVISKDVHEWMSWITYRRVVLTPTNMNGFLRFIRSHDPQYLPRRVRVLAFHSQQIDPLASELKRLKIDLFQNLENFHLSDLNIGTWLPLLWGFTTALTHLSIRLNILAYIPSHALTSVTHLHLDFRQDQNHSCASDMRIILPNLCSLTHLMVKYWGALVEDSFLDWLHGPEMLSLQLYLLVGIRPLPVVPERFVKLVYYPKSNSDAFVIWRDQEFGVRNFWLYGETQLKARRLHI
ncbi:hypothetical protein DL96DRAFT_1557414 [Flagelloscypha sp. PMI_526]|nr:hypothetical protein DL96DRAFT_1557414 [Flagelloscypha sp. PMI_526]